jgi:hypothetical protein
MVQPRSRLPTTTEGAVARFESPAIVLDVLTSREGVFSVAGHDLRLRAAGVDVEVRADRVVVDIDARAIEPICARRGGKDAPGVLSDADLRRIHSNVRGEVLQSARYPTIHVELKRRAPTVAMINAQLTLCGRTGPLRVFVERRGDRLYGHAELSQRAFGLEPYQTMFGAIRVADLVEIEFEAPWAMWPLAVGER